MSDARDAFQNLQAITGRGFETTALYADWDEVEQRIARYRTGRLVLSSVGVLAVVGGVTFAAMAMPFKGNAGPAVPPSATPSASASAPASGLDTRAAACLAAQVVPGKSVGNLGGLMGWFNTSPAVPCDQWPDQVLDHPDTILINTTDNTMVEAYYRTNIAALGIYAHLGDDYVVPDPDPSWPADSLVLIDARTQEVLEVTALADLPDLSSFQAPALSVFGEPYPAGMPAPNLVDLIAPGLGGRYISENDTDYVVGLLRPDAAGHTVEVPVPFPKGDILVMAATHWECSWITEYVWASEANDPKRTSAAAAELEKFPNLDVIQKYNPQLGEGDRISLIPRIVGGDTEYAKRWLNTSCSGLMNQ